MQNNMQRTALKGGAAAGGRGAGRGPAAAGGRGAGRGAAAAGRGPAASGGRGAVVAAPASTAPASTPATGGTPAAGGAAAPGGTPAAGGAAAGGAGGSDKSIFASILPGNYNSLTFMLQLVTLSTPYFIVFFFIFVSIINSNIKGFIYLIGLIFVYMIINLFKLNSNRSVSPTCKQLSNYHTDNPAFVSGLYSYTIVYMMLPMIFNNTFNILFIILLFIFFMVDIVVRQQTFKCLDGKDVFIGVILGILIGSMWAYSLKVSGNNSLLYYEDILSSKESCQKLKTNFKCGIYKNGEMIKTVTQDGIAL